MNHLSLAVWLLGAVTWLLAFGWLYQAWQWFRHLPEVADLTLSPPAPVSMSRRAAVDLAVIVPACNEQESIVATLESLLASTGIRLQVIAVNDRSTDQTGHRMDAVAASHNESSRSGNHSKYNQIKVLHVENLPVGWLGKPHALHLGADQALSDHAQTDHAQKDHAQKDPAQSDWLLFTDGDVLFSPDALALALAYAKAEEVDHLVLMPDWIMKTPGEAAMHGALHALSAWTLHPWRIPDPGSRDFLGVGAFNLVRRTAYEAIGGFTALRMEVLEDLRLGWTLKRAGHRQKVALGPGLVAVRWSVGAWGVVRNLEKNLFALYRYRVPTTLFASFGLAVQVVLPLVALTVGILHRDLAGSLAFAGGVAVYLGVAAVYLASRRVTRVPLLYAIFYPAATALFLFAHLRSMTLALLRGGVLWRGTLYSLKDLRDEAGPFW